MQPQSDAQLRQLIPLSDNVAVAGYADGGNRAWAIDRQHGQQFKASQLTTTHPASPDGIERYLASGMVSSRCLIASGNEEAPTSNRR